MILRRIAQHVREQNWTAVAIDFVIVVVGVFLGLQLGNWNTARAEDARERLLLRELRTELAESVRQLEIKQRAFHQIGRSGEEAVACADPMRVVPAALPDRPEGRLIVVGAGKEGCEVVGRDGC